MNQNRIPAYITPEDLDDGHTVFHITVDGTRWPTAYATLQNAREAAQAALTDLRAQPINRWEPQYDSNFSFESDLPCGYAARFEP